MKRVGLRAYVLFSFVVFGVMIAVVTAGLWLASDEIESTAVNMNSAIESITAAQNILDRLEANRRRTLLTTQPMDSVTRDRLRMQMSSDLLASLKSIEVYIEGDEERQTVNEVRASIDRFIATYEHQDLKKLYGPQLYLYTAPAFDQAVSDISHLIRINQEQAKEFEVQAKVMSEAYKESSLRFWIVVLASSALLFGMFYRLVWAPIFRLQQAIESFARFKTLPATPIKGLTEIEQIGDNFRELTQTLQRQSEQRLVFLAAVAHDLKNPLGAIEMSLDLMTNHNPDKAFDPQIRAVLGRQVRQLRRLVEDLLDASRIEAGTLELRRSPGDLRDVLTDCATLFKSVSADHSIELSLPASEVLLSFDMHRLNQVFNNLLSNAIKYSPRGGLVNVDLKTVGDYAVVAIRDRGIGIDSDELNGIFEPFRRPHSNRHQIPGVGLGLSTAKKIVEAHDGWIQVRSRRDQGSLFIIVLPLKTGLRERPSTSQVLSSFADL